MCLDPGRIRAVRDENLFVAPPRADCTSAARRLKVLLMCWTATFFDERDEPLYATGAKGRYGSRYRYYGSRNLVRDSAFLDERGERLAGRCTGTGTKRHHFGSQHPHRPKNQ